MTHPFDFGNSSYAPEVQVLPVTTASGKIPVVEPAYRHAHSREQYEEMLADTADTRPIKKFYAEE